MFAANGNLLSFRIAGDSAKADFFDKDCAGKLHLAMASIVNSQRHASINMPSGNESLFQIKLWQTWRTTLFVEWFF
ncbi:hypothetical protein D3870_12145 [Noviherbaspirillum cavernae]|uniref:Uncharacterized protein n=1 Tax=Noviherbaspirillum cavernae TaxID=2320862 RepID=A0A418X2Q6_9BURK|nr:hypothetical protein D3870_12145 [Noviherbaspirillum cavernae]